MNVLLEAVKDLLNFFLEESTSLLRGRTEILLIENKKNEDENNVTLPLLAKIKDENVSSQVLIASNITSRFGYIAIPFSRVYIRPVLTFDGEGWHAGFARKVEIIGYEGRFVHIKDEGRFGWILKDDITTEVSDIFPTFNIGEIYSANHPETKKLRTIQSDEFLARELFLPLQDIEYVSYVLNAKRIILPWDERRPRISGNWQNLLKGKSGVSIGISPKTGSIMEFIKENSEGFVAAVESVEVDETITISGVGRLIEGEYRKEVFSRKEWQEWRPVFIQIT